jgi:hypothetical protein
MSHMTQTQTPRDGTPDRDRRPDPAPGRDDTQTRTQTTAQTRTGPDGYPDPGPGPDGPDAAQTQTQTRTRTQTPDPDPSKVNDLERSGPDDTQTQTTQTRTRTQTASDRVAKARGWIGAGGYLTTLTIVIGIVASIGQKEYAEKKAKFVNQIGAFGVDLTPWFAPFVFDLAVAALLHGGLRAARARHSPWPWWICGAAVAGLSTYTNFDHDGGKVTGTASIGLFVIWGLYLLNEYKTIIRKREVEDSIDDEFRSTDVLFTVDKALADRAWFIARTKPLAVGLAYRHRLGETDLTKRDLAILAARIYRDVLADQLDVQMNPTAAAPAGSTDDEKAPAKTRPVRWWQRRRRARARRLAEMTAGDAIDRLFGLPVPERSGVIVAKVTYAEQDDRSLLGSVTAAAYVQPAPAIASAAAPAAPALPAPNAAPVAAAAPRRRVSAAPAAAELLPADQGEPTVVVVPDGAPAGNAGINWVPIDKIPGLPAIDPAIVCECHAEVPKRCGKPLLHHVQRRGKYVLAIVSRVEEWDTRAARIGKREIKEVCEVGSSGTQNEMALVFDQLRALAAQQRAGGDAAATASAQVIEADAVPAAEVEATVSEEASTEK